MTETDGPPQAPRGTVLDAARAVGVVFGGSLVLAGAAGWSLASALRSLARGRAPRPAAALGVAATAAYALLAVPWMRGWGATEEELAAALPGDELVPEPAIRSTRAVSVAAPPEEVWPWLAQIGQDRGGFYSYDWLENLAGCRLASADRIHPEWQHREPGELVMLHWARGIEVERFEPGRALVLKGWGAFVLRPAEGGRATRLLARARVPGGPGAAFYAVLVEIPHFVMERRMLLGIKERAERARTA